MATTHSGGTETNVSNDAFAITIDGVDSGLAVASATELQATIETVPIQYEQDATPRGQRITNQPVTFNMSFNELTNTNLKHYLADLAVIDSLIVHYGEKKGEQIPQFEIKLFSLAPSGGVWSGKVFTFHKASFMPNGAIVLDPSTDEVMALPVTVTVFKDTSQAAGREYFSFGAASVTAPTVSSTSPVDGASGVAVDAALTITFSIEMGIGTLNAQNIFISEVAKTSTAFDDYIVPTAYTLDSTKKILTIAHPNFNSGTLEYQVILGTGIASDDGVPLAAPYVFDFTTVA